MPSQSDLEGPTQSHERFGEWQGGKLRAGGPPPRPLLAPVEPKRQIAVRLEDPYNAQARELAGRRGQAVGRVLADLLSVVLPEALAVERSRDAERGAAGA